MSNDDINILYIKNYSCQKEKKLHKILKSYTLTNQQGISEDRFTEFRLGNRTCTHTVIIRSDIKKQCLSGRLEEPSVYHVDSLRLSKKKKKKKRLHTLLHVNVFVLEPLLRSRINGWKKTDRIYRVCSHPQHSKHFTQEVLIHTLTHSKWNKYLTHFDERGKLALTHIQADLTSKSAPK